MSQEASANDPSGTAKTAPVSEPKPDPSGQSQHAAENAPATTEPKTTVAANPITFDLTPAPTALSRLQHQMDQTSEKFAARAARFGATDLKKHATEIDVLGARRAHSRQGFMSGFDPQAPDQQSRREMRAKRFGDQLPVDAEQTARDARAQRFGGEARQLVGLARVCDDALERRRDVAVGEVARPEVLHVFGVDMLNTSEVLRHFQEYGPSWCEWLNDSSCNVAFEDPHTMRRAIRGLTEHGKQLGIDEVVNDAPEDKMDDGEGAGLSLAVAGDGTLAEDLTWRSGKPFEKGDTVIPIWIRQATEKDKRPEMPNPKSRWSRSINSKKRISSSSNRRNSDTTSSRRRRRRSDTDAVDVAQRPSRRGPSLKVHQDRKIAILKAQTKKVTKMDLDRALGS
ncbi:Nuclear cap-binding protein subunit 3 [Gracilaria domingensis]|nr:Nuclear cap-binding protein subunit 3 [Gracilaria domingensis]